MLHDDIERGPRHRPPKPPDPAEDHEDHDLTGRVPFQHDRRDETVEVDKERPRQPGDHAGNDEGRQPDAERRDAHRLKPLVVLPRAAERHAEPRLRQSRGEPDRREKQDDAEKVELQPVEHVEARKLVPHIDRHAVLPAIGGPRDGEIVDHLSEGERDHDEEDAAGPERQDTDKHRRDGRDDHGDGPEDQHLVGPFDQEGRLHQRLIVLGVKGENARRIAAKAKERRMAEGHHAAEAKRDVQPDARHGEDNDLGYEGDDKRLIHRRGQQRDAHERGAEDRVDDCLAVHDLTPKRPEGLKIRTTAIRI